MKTLLLLRHGKSSWSDPSLDDHDRPLKPRGIKAAKRMGKLLRRCQLKPDTVLCSTAVRAVETLRLFLKAAGIEPPVQFVRELYHCEPAQFVLLLQGVNDNPKTILVVGHNPGLESFLQRLIGEASPFPTGALAEIELELSHWSQLTEASQGRLINLWQPRALED